MIQPSTNFGQPIHSNNLSVSIFSGAQVLSPLPQAAQITVKSLPNSPMTLTFRSPIDNKEKTYKFSSGEVFRSAARSKFFKIPTISEFKLNEDPKESDPINQEQPEPQCRICLEVAAQTDFISPCLCKGFSQYVHESCLKMWLLKGENPDINISSCEVCKNPLKMEFIYKNSLSPCKENSCKAWLPFIISMIMLLGLLCFYFQDYLGRDSVVIAVSAVFAIVGAVCLGISLVKTLDVCLERRISDWRILSLQC